MLKTNFKHEFTMGLSLCHLAVIAAQLEAMLRYNFNMCCDMLVLLSLC